MWGGKKWLENSCMQKGVPTRLSLISPQCSKPVLLALSFSGRARDKANIVSMQTGMAVEDNISSSSLWLIRHIITGTASTFRNYEYEDFLFLLRAKVYLFAFSRLSPNSAVFRLRNSGICREQNLS